MIACSWHMGVSSCFSKTQYWKHKLRKSITAFSPNNNNLYSIRVGWASENGSIYNKSPKENEVFQSNQNLFENPRIHSKFSYKKSITKMVLLSRYRLFHVELDKMQFTWSEFQNKTNDRGDWIHDHLIRLAGLLQHLALSE